MNGKFHLAGISIIFALLSACGGGTGSSSSTNSSSTPPSSSSTTPPSGNTSATPGSNTDTTRPPETSGGGGRPANVAGYLYAVNGSSNNLSAFAINATTSDLTAVPGSPFPTGGFPKAITVSPNNRFLYVTNANTHDVSAFSIDDATGTLSEIPGSPYPVGEPFERWFRTPSSVNIDPSGRFAYVVCGGDYGAMEGAAVPFHIAGQIWAFSIDATTGAWTPVPGSPYDVHNNRNLLAFDRQGKFAYASSNDNQAYNDTPSPGIITTFAINSTTGALIQVGEPVVTAGSGQTPVTIDPSGKFAYIASDAGMSSFTIDPATGTLGSIDSPHGLAQSSYPTFRIDASGKFVYASNYDPYENGNGIWAFTIDAGSGRLSDVAGSPYHVGKDYTALPSAFGAPVDPSGRFVYMGSGGTSFCETYDPCVVGFDPGKIQAFAVNPATGALSEIAGSPFSIETEPDSITFDPSGKAAYVLSRGDNNRGDWIYVYTINNSTGALNPTGRVPTGAYPVALAIVGAAS